jgi:HSP20 family protein
MTKAGAWNPLSELLAVQKRMNALFESALARSNFGGQDRIDTWTPVCDVYSTPEQMVFRLELPGLSQEAIDVRIDAGELVVEGNREMEPEQEGERFHRVERSYGRFSRRFRLSSAVDPSSVTAAYRNGVLEIVLPVRSPGQSDPIRVPVR